jgi:hypothetical protein
MHSWLVEGGLSAKEKEKAPTRAVVIAWADEVLQHYQ